MMIKNLKDMNAIYGILEKVANEVNDYYWRSNSEVDLERASELRDLEKHLIERGYIDSGYDEMLGVITLKRLSISSAIVTRTFQVSTKYEELCRSLHVFLIASQFSQLQAFIWVSDANDC